MLRYALRIVRSNAPVHPYKVLYLNPSGISYYNREFLWGPPGLGKIIGGEWDQPDNRKLLQSHYIYTGLKQRFKYGMEWTRTDYFRNAASAYRRGEQKWGYDTIEQFLESRCDFVDELYTDMAQNGYIPNSDRNYRVPQEDGYRRSKVHIHGLEPLVLIGRTGEFYLREGFHRVTIAALVWVEQIPVQVLGRHPHWQSRGKSLGMNGRWGSVDPNYRDHPDLKEVEVSDAG